MNEIRDERYDELCKRLSQEKVFSVLDKKQGQGKGIILKNICRICWVDITRPAVV
ncbi:MAG: hypothetical protein HZB80_01710 [Deltaproteobacteria bacterium]|nr:hypothetical protein [Deltaproteobacteria bacterium]